MEEDNLEKAIEFAYRGFLTDEEVLEVTQKVRESKNCGLCMWYQSPSLVKGTDNYTMCHELCDGYGRGCDFAMYIETKENENK